MEHNTDNFLDFIIKIKNNSLLPFDDLVLFYFMMKEASFYDFALLEYMFFHIETNISNGDTLTENMALVLNDIKCDAVLYGKKNESKVLDRVNEILSSHSSIERLKENDAIATYINNIISRKSVDEKEHWYKLISECRGLSQAKITKKFYFNIEDITNNIGLISYKNTLINIIDHLLNVKVIDDEFVYVSKENINIIRGFIYSSIFIMDDDIIVLIEKFALKCFNKIRNRGFLSLALANSCLYALSESKMLMGVSSLSYLNVMVKDKNVQKKIELYLLELASFHNVSVYDIEEISVPDYGLSIL